MSDFYQTGIITTLHRLAPTPDRLERLEAALKRHSRTLPVGLLLPCLYSELQTPAMPLILEELKKVKYLREVVIGLGKTDRAGFKHAQEFFAPLPTEKKILWVESPRVEALFGELAEQGISAGPPGKGRTVWMVFGYMIASERSKVIALHDCDILTYDREIAGAALLPGGQSEPGLRVRQGLLRPLHATASTAG